MFSRTKIASVLAEFLGVVTLTSVILSVSKSGVGFSLFIASAVGAAAGMLVLILGSSSGPHFNPAVTLGLWTTRRTTTLRAIVNIAAQMLGGYAALKLYEYLVNQQLNNISGSEFDWRVLVAEAIGAFLITFGIAAALYQGYKGVRMALTFGGAVFIGMLVASLASNGLANPAFAIGLESWSRAYVLGPLVGGLLGANLYAYVFAGTARTTITTKSVLSIVKQTSTKKTPVKKTTVKKTTKKTTKKK